jgi:hypothetical protein
LSSWIHAFLGRAVTSYIPKSLEFMTLELFCQILPSMSPTICRWFAPNLPLCHFGTRFAREGISPNSADATTSKEIFHVSPTKSVRST